MKSFYQDTDIITSGSYASSNESVDETSGSQIDSNIIPNNLNLGILNPTIAAIQQVKNRNVQSSAIRFLTISKDVLVFLYRNNYDSSHLPPLYATQIEDGSLLIDWIFPNFRIGFSFEEDPSNNGWYIVTDKKLEEYTGSGYLTNENFKDTILRMFMFAINNS
jgi:hypothetical protein